MFDRESLFAVTYFLFITNKQQQQQQNYTGSFLTEIISFVQTDT